MRRSPSLKLSTAWCTLALSAAAAGCTSAPPAAAPPEPPMVAVATPVTSDVTDYVDYTGRTDAVDSVEVRARVNGYLDQIKFKAGAEVKEGDLLFVIDERPYKAELDRVEGQIKLAEAKHKYAGAEVVRNEPLVKSGATTKSEFDKMVAARDEAAAAIEATKAAAESAKLNLKFCQIHAPIGGRVSRNYITAGNLVTADSTLLTTIVSQDPMFVYFDVDEPTILRVQQLIREGKFPSARRTSDIPVTVGLANEPGQFPHKGTIEFVDNRVDPGTGTLKVRAVLPNPEQANGDRVFAAGMFVRVRVPLGQPRKQLLVTERALGSDQGQKFLYVVAKQDGKDVVEYRPVAVGPPHKGGLRVVYPVKLVRAKEGLRMARPDEAAAAEDSL
ncbi:MAG TPA: efflux RND transporter periplasmic adaptor subunit, partial [Gemmataceae bacterium]